ITTLAQAHAYAKPIVGLSAVLMRGFHHGALVYLKDSGLRGPGELIGRRIGVRAWSQTTGVWVRGILRSEYGIDAARITWVTVEDAHVAEFRDPPFVVRALAGADLPAMLRDGSIDAGVALQGLQPGETRTVIPDAAAAAAAWFRRTGIYPANHAICVRRDLLTEHPWLAGELMALFTAAKEAAPQPPNDLVGDALPYGLTANRNAIEMLTRFAAEQGLVPRATAADELFAA
ncbi:MAG: ABC transporter substrate-binding protein, partial [Acetobacteraceae bacterium]